MKPQSPYLKPIVSWWNRTYSFSRSILGRVPSRVYVVGAFAGLSIIFGLLTARYGSTDFDYQVGDLVRRDIVPPVDITVKDDQKTAQNRTQAADRVKKVFVYDPQVERNSENDLTTAFIRLRRRYLEAVADEYGTSQLSPGQLNSPKYKTFLDQFIDSQRDGFQLRGGEPALRTLAKQQFSEELQQSLQSQLAGVMQRYIYTDIRAEDLTSGQIPIMIRGSNEQRQAQAGSLIALTDARNELQQRIENLPGFTDPQKRALVEMLLPLVAENLFYDQGLTQKAKEQAQANEPEVTEVMRHNVPIGRKGERVDPSLVHQLDLIKQRIGQPSVLLRVFGLSLVHAILLYGLWLISFKTKRHNLSGVRTFAVAVMALLINVLIIHVGTAIAEDFTGPPFSGNELQYQFAIPYAIAALLIVLLVDMKLAFLCGLLIGVYTILISNGSVEMSLFAMGSSLFAVYSGGRYRQRNVVMRAGGFVALGNMLLANVVIFISGQLPSFRIYFYDMGLAALGGIIAGLIVSGLIPVYESVFNILTDVKLLELSNADMPLLKRMAIRTPGSQQHSYMVSLLAEEAAKAVNANALLARIGCYYHDIGKTAAPNMFIENQAGGPNPHDKIDPKSSVRIIANHVKRGIEMGKEHHLPQQIIDLIPQHHGTRLLHYFYNKAKAQAAGTGAEVNEADFRYPGPKPRTKEAAILMLADSAEAAVRSLQDHSEPAMRAMIKKVMDDIISDGQLDESNLSMREITHVREALIRALKNHYHERVRYPGFNPDDSGSAETQSSRELTDTKEIPAATVTSPALVSDAALPKSSK